MTLMEQFANPDLFDSLSMGERLAGATVTMLMGLGITFAILIIIWIFIAIMSKTAGTAKKEEKATSEPVPVTPVNEAKGEDVTADAELVAVIMAAIAASSGGSSFVPTLKIKKITRISGHTNAWNSAGLNECIDSRRM